MPRIKLEVIYLAPDVVDPALGVRMGVVLVPQREIVEFIRMGRANVFVGAIVIIRELQSVNLVAAPVATLVNVLLLKKPGVALLLQQSLVGRSRVLVIMVPIGIVVTGLVVVRVVLRFLGADQMPVIMIVTVVQILILECQPVRGLRLTAMKLLLPGGLLRAGEGIAREMTVNTGCRFGRGMK